MCHLPDELTIKLGNYLPTFFPFLLHQASNMTQITLVDNEIVHEWVAEASQLRVGDVVPLADICESMNSDDPQYHWKETYRTDFVQRWVITSKDSDEPVLVGSAGRIKICASRPHGNYVPVNDTIPVEYERERVYRGGDKDVYKAKQFWWILDNGPQRRNIGTYMMDLESALRPLLSDSFKSNQSIKGLRSDWNTPGNRAWYELEHPLFCSKNEQKERLKTLDEADLLSAHEWVTALEETCSSNYVITPGRPQVLAKCGAHSNPSVHPVPAETDEDFHRPDDIIWFSGEIHAKANRASYRGSNIGWSTNWRLESVIRIAKMLPSSLTQSAATDNTPDPILTQDTPPSSPRKRRRLDPKDYPSPTKHKYVYNVQRDDDRDDNEDDRDGGDHSMDDLNAASSSGQRDP